MSACPYTWFRGFFNPKSSNSTEASFLRVSVIRNNEIKVDVALPARSARWLIDLIPNDVLTKIREEGIPIDDIQTSLSKRVTLVAEEIFILKESHRLVSVWLE